MAHRFLESPQEQRIAAQEAVSRVSTDVESVDLAARALSRTAPRRVDVAAPPWRTWGKAGVLAQFD
jgi:hypothetical protein